MFLEIAAGLYLLGDYVYHRWIESHGKPKPAERPKAPRVDEGATIPLIYGRCRVRSPVLALTRRLDIQDGNKVVPGLPAEVKVYGLDMLFVLGVPFQGAGSAHKVTLEGMWAGDKKMAWAVFANNPNLARLLAGDGWPDSTLQITVVTAHADVPDIVGFIGGGVEFLNGRDDQVLVDPITGAQLSFIGHRLLGDGIAFDRIAGYRGYAVAYLYNGGEGSFERSWFIGSQPTPQAYSFEVTSYAAGGMPSGARIGDDANPVDVIWDLLTGTFAKLGLDIALLDYTTFQAAAATLATELHGFSYAFDDTQDAIEAINLVLRQIDGVIYEDPRTGSIKIKLVRDDYDVNLVPNINPANCIAPQNYAGGSWTNVVNKVRVVFSNRLTDYQEDSASSHNLANAVGQSNRQNEIELQFPGVCTKALAETIAGRELAARSRPVAKCRAIVDRSFWATCPGDVVTLTFPEYNITKLAFRVASVDRGQLRDGKIALDLIQDVTKNPQSAFPVGPPKPLTAPPEPPTYRVFTEAPYWLQLQAWQQGLINTPDVQRTLSAIRPDGSAIAWNETSTDGTIDDTELPLSTIPTTALVLTAYGREKEPYDNATGLVIQSLSGSFPSPTVATASDIRALGRHLILVGREIMAYETTTDLGGGQYRLNNVWRGLLDTSAADHAVGDVVYWIAPSLVGRRSWAAIAGVVGSAHPLLNGKGSGEDPTDTINIGLRALFPARGADFALCGEVAAGTQGAPSVAAPAGQLGTFKKLTNLEEGFGYTFHTRDCLLSVVSRGDDADETPSDVDPTNWDIYGQKIRATFTPSIGTDDAQVLIKPDLAAKNTGDAALLGAAGYGDLDVILDTKRVKPSNGVQPAVTYRAWNPPKIRVRAERWRNLIGNARWDYNGAGTNVGPGWVEATGASQVRASTSSITRLSTDCYVGLESGASSVITETFDVTGFVPRGLTARLEFYARNLAGGTDTVTAKIEALDVANASLGSTTITGGAITPGATTWTRYSGTLVLPASTTQIKVTYTFATSLGTQNAVVTEACVRLGDVPQYDVLANSSFDASLASWTVDSGGFVQATTIASPSAGYAQGGAFASSAMHQDYTLPAGYEVGGTAILNCWRAQTLTGDTGDVDLQILDGGGAVIANQRTGAETLANLNQWYKRRLAVELPAGAVKVRVKFAATRSAGAGNSGACVDELVVQVHKHLSDPAYHRKLDFSTPTVQPVVKTWQEWHIAYARSLWDAGIADPAVISALDGDQR
jgi:hypothetical protein